MSGPTAPTAPVLFVNGVHVTGDSAAISVRDRGFTLADGLFETMRVHKGVVFRLDRHLARLAAGLKVLRIEPPPQVRQWIETAVAQAARHDMSVRLTVTRGPGPGGLAPPVDTQPTVVVAVNPPPAFAPHIYEEGLRAVTASGRRNPHAVTNGLKTLAYTDAVVAWLDAQRAGADEAIFLDTEGHCSEATASNLFAYHHGILVTPPLSCAALPGVTRGAVLELARSLGVAADERPLEPAELTAADEAFLTSSLRGIAPLRSLDGSAIGTRPPGPLTRQIMAAYQQLVAQECGTA